MLSALLVIPAALAFRVSLSRFARITHSFKTGFESRDLDLPMSYEIMNEKNCRSGQTPHVAEKKTDGEGKRLSASTIMAIPALGTGYREVHVSILLRR
jgi:hypothetical protein